MHDGPTQPAPATGDAEPAPSGLGRLLARGWPYALVLLVGAFVLLPHLGDFGFWDPWEPKYAETTREMLDRGSWVVPYYREEVRLTKPILTYWGIMAGAAVFGLNELGARIGGVALVLATMAGVYYAVSRLRGRRAGLLAALVTGSLPHCYFLGRQAMPDVYLFTTLGTAVVFLVLGLFGPDERRNVHFGVSYAGLALAVLAKGPILAGLIYGVPLAVWAVARIDWTLLARPERRRDTLRFAVLGSASAALAAGSAGVAALVGSPRAWWGYSEVHREQVAHFRETLEIDLGRFRIAEILLLLAAATALAGAGRLARSRAAAGGTTGVGTVGLAGVAAVALTTLLLARGEQRILTAAVLGGIAATAVFVHEVWRLVRIPQVWRELRPWLRPVARQLALFAAVFVVIAGPWHVAILIAQDHGYFTDFILKHNVQRASEKINQSGFADYYLGVLTFAFFPWSCLVPLALATAVGWWERNPLRRYGPEAYLLITAGVVFVTFSGPVTKFPHYLAPLIVPGAVLVGLTLDRLLGAAHPAAARLGWMVAALLYLPPMLDLLRDNGLRHLVGSFTVKSYVPDEVRLGPYGVALLVVPLFLMLLATVFRSRLTVPGLVVSAVLLGHYATGTLIPAISPHKTMKHLCETWQRLRTSDAPLCFFGATTKHGAYFYTDNHVRKMDGAEPVADLLGLEPDAYCIVERSLLSGLEAEFDRRFGRKLPVVDDSHFDYALVGPATE